MTQFSAKASFVWKVEEVIETHFVGIFVDSVFSVMFSHGFTFIKVTHCSRKIKYNTYFVEQFLLAIVRSDVKGLISI